jgi:hypothetical protein
MKREAPLKRHKELGWHEYRHIEWENIHDGQKRLSVRLCLCACTRVHTCVYLFRLWFSVRACVLMCERVCVCALICVCGQISAFGLIADSPWPHVITGVFDLRGGRSFAEITSFCLHGNPY